MMLTWSMRSARLLPALNALSLPVFSRGRAPVPNAPITMDSCSDLPLFHQAPMASSQTSPRLSNSWSDEFCRMSDSPLAMDLTARSGERPLLSLSPALLLT